MTDNGNQPAFPLKSIAEIYPGLSKREAFAMAAMQGICASREEFDAKVVAQCSVLMADALLAELEKSK